jgi:mRNA-degrading endonuclease RelE of RelBE toxin-antitoxin system
MKIYFQPSAAKELKKLDKTAQERIKGRVSELEKNPELGKKLVPSRFLSLRVGDYRAIYEISEEKIVVLFVGHRKNVYGDFNKIF